MLPTVLMTVCLSTVINGLAFYFVGYLKLGTNNSTWHHLGIISLITSCFPRVTFAHRLHITLFSSPCYSGNDFWFRNFSFVHLFPSHDRDCCWYSYIQHSCQPGLQQPHSARSGYCSGNIFTINIALSHWRRNGWPSCHVSVVMSCVRT